MSDLAIRDLATRKDGLFESIRQALLSMFGRESDHNLPAGITRRQRSGLRTMGPAARPAQPALGLVRQASEHHASHEADTRWARHPQLRSRQADPVTAGSTRAARLEAERGLILARGGKLVEAAEAFTSAACDPEIDLSSLPGFWDLPRNGMFTAVRAYERTQRLRDAAALEARIRHLLKPRAMRPASPRQSRVSASGD